MPHKAKHPLNVSTDSKIGSFRTRTLPASPNLDEPASLPDVPEAFQPDNKPNLFEPPQVVLDRLNEVIPPWVKRWCVNSSVTTVRLWIEPVDGRADPREVTRFLEIAQEAIYPIPLMIQLPPSVQSTDGSSLQRVHTLIAPRVRSENKSAGKSSLKRPNNEELFGQIARTLPIEVSLLRPVHYRLTLPNGSLEFVVLRVHAPAHKESDLRSWREHFEQQHGVSVFFSRLSGFGGIKHQLKLFADQDSLLRIAHVGEIRGCIDGICGDPPTESPDVNLAASKRRREDMLDIPFVAMDGENVLDREDLIYAERLPSGNMRVLVAFIDITDIVEPGSDRDKFAQRVGQTIYGRHRSFSTLGTKLAHSAGHFALGESRPAWVVEIILDSATGDSLSAHWPSVRRAWVKATHYVTPQQFTASLAATESGEENLICNLAKAGALLHLQRMNSQRLLRVDGDSVGHEVLAEMMIAAKSSFGRFIELTGVGGIWRVHAKPSSEVKRDFVRQMAEIRIFASEDDFDEPLAFASLLRRLEDLQSAPARALARQILDTFLLKTAFSTCNVGHYGLGLSHYLEIKPRDASGIRNQHQLDAVFGESAQLSEEELRHCALWRNARKVRDDERRYKLRFLEMLDEKLSDHTTIHEATVIADRDDHVLVSVSGFTKWGFVNKDSYETNSLPVGMTFYGVLDGFHVERMRFRFSPLWGIET